MPAYNAARFIQQAIDSVLSQTFTSWELIVVNDGSKDNTSEIVKAYTGTNAQIILLEQENKKQAAARNLGIAHARGEWVAFIDADDLWTPDKLKVQYDSIHEIAADVFFSGGLMVDQFNQVLSDYKTVYGHFDALEMYKMLLRYNPIPVLSVIVKKSYIELTGKQDERANVVGCEDWDYWLRLAKKDAVFFGIEKKLFRYRVSPGSTSSNKLQMNIAENEVLSKNVDVKLLHADERLDVYKRIDELGRNVIEQLYLYNHQALAGYFKYMKRLTGFYKYTIALLLYRFFKLHSKRLVLPIIYRL